MTASQPTQIPDANAIRAATSLTAAFPGEKFSQPQYQIVARIASGEDVRSWDIGETRSMLALIDRCVIDAEATTGRLVLLTAEVVSARLERVEAEIAHALEMIDELLAAIEVGERVLARAQARAAAEAATLAMMAARPPSIGDLSAARSAHAEALLNLAEQQSADRRRREQLDHTSAVLRDLRRDKLRLELAASRRCSHGHTAATSSNA